MEDAKFRVTRTTEGHEVTGGRNSKWPPGGPLTVSSRATWMEPPGAHVLPPKWAWSNKISCGLCFLASFVGKCTNTNPNDLNECHMLIWNFHFLSKPKRESESITRGQNLLPRISQLSRGCWISCADCRLSAWSIQPTTGIITASQRLCVWLPVKSGGPGSRDLLTLMSCKTWWLNPRAPQFFIYKTLNPGPSTSPAQPRARAIVTPGKVWTFQEAKPRTQGALMLEGRLAEKTSLKMHCTQQT